MRFLLSAEDSGENSAAIIQYKKSRGGGSQSRHPAGYLFFRVSHQFAEA